MLQRIHSSRTILALLMVAATVTIGAGTSESSGAAPEGAAGSVLAKEKAGEIPQQANNDRNRKKIRQENDKASKAGEPLYPQQARGGWQSIIVKQRQLLRARAVTPNRFLTLLFISNGSLKNKFSSDEPP
jgi:hypothetical protein